MNMGTKYNAERARYQREQEQARLHEQTMMFMDAERARQQQYQEQARLQEMMDAEKASQ